MITTTKTAEHNPNSLSSALTWPASVSHQNALCSPKKTGKFDQFTNMLRLLSYTKAVDPCGRQQPHSAPMSQCRQTRSFLEFCNNLPQKSPWHLTVWLYIAACYVCRIFELFIQTGLLRQRSYLRLTEHAPLYWGCWQLLTAPSPTQWCLLWARLKNRFVRKTPKPHICQRHRLFWDQHIYWILLSRGFISWGLTPLCSRKSKPESKLSIQLVHP